MFGKIISRYVTIFAGEWYIKDEALRKEPSYMGLLPLGIDILPPSDDRIFKLLLTSPEGKPALMDLISATIKRPVIDVIVRNNELPLWDANEKAERLDVNCKIDDGSQVDLEMQASRVEEDSDGEHKNIKGKSIYYLCDLHSSQPSKGLRRYDKLAQTYQVTFCSYTVFPNWPDYANSFSMRHDTDNKLLSDAIHVIYVEL
ncbi:MAG: Rpn family recombination-promoting nuclease/putative transposase, partial [Synergistaceae bacterium]|nr:Rpn family recombination-promoting nuclease/putative transposase [Synergistaceae bacterium]